jgi:hypothetical protein
VKVNKNCSENSYRLFKFDKDYFTNDYISAIIKTTKNGSDFIPRGKDSGERIDEL